MTDLITIYLDRKGNTKARILYRPYEPFHADGHNRRHWHTEPASNGAKAKAAMRRYNDEALDKTRAFWQRFRDLEYNPATGVIRDGKSPDPR